jgi:structure-specific recognition protein 1
MFSTFMRMHGAKYDYKISYEDIEKLFLLLIPDGVSAAIVISLEKPIRQGNQTYSNLVLLSQRLEHTIQVLLLFNLCFLCVHFSTIA